MSDLRTFNGRFPAGPYHFEVIGFEERVGRTSCQVFELRLQLVGTDAMIHYYLADTIKARWAWGDLVEEFEEIPQLVGKQFIALIGREPRPPELRDSNSRSQSEYINRVEQIMAEVI